MLTRIFKKSVEELEKKADEYSRKKEVKKKVKKEEEEEDERLP